MKRLIILLTILLPISAIAQEASFESLFKEYSTNENCTTINISNAMLRSMEINIDAEYMQVIAVENSELIPTFNSQANDIMSRHEVIMSVNTSDKSVEIRQNKNKNGMVTEIFILVCDKGEGILMHIAGKNLELNNIGSIINQF